MTDLLGPQPDWLNSHNGCTYNPQPELSPVGDCGKPSALHIRLRGGEGMVAACDGHRSYALAQLPVLDWHAWMAWCNMPGAIWHPSPTPDEAGSYCALDESGVAPSRAETAELTA